MYSPSVAISEFHEIKLRSEIWNHMLKKRCAAEANLASVLNSIDSPLLLTAVWFGLTTQSHILLYVKYYKRLIHTDDFLETARYICM